MLTLLTKFNNNNTSSTNTNHRLETYTITALVTNGNNDCATTG